MGDVKRWSVTYTKHVKQKRKVYQDGFLELRDSSHKIMLYDDCEKLLECRIVKKDEVVRSGETLTFNAYLVDIGDVEGEQKPMANVNLQGGEKRSPKKAGLFHGQKIKHNSIPIDRKPDSGKNKAPSSSLSPSQRIIREFKKNEMNKYGAPRSFADTTRTSYSEWNVLYTTQITQKAKKYHDGILRVTACGSQGRQVTLYDLSRRLLDSRFLKKDEVIGSGGSLALDGHLVDIGEPEGDHEPLMDLKILETKSTPGGKTGLSHRQQTKHSSFENGSSGLSGSSKSLSPLNCLKSVKPFMKEWDGLYTTQITQKAKKYHSGILRLASSNSYQMQATLLSEDGAVLSHKYLKSFKDVKIGSTFEFPNYLVEVGELRTSPEEPPKVACSKKDTDSNFSGFEVDNVNLESRFPIRKPLHDEPPKVAFSKKDTDSNFSGFEVDNVKLGRSLPTRKPLRDANGILSFLRKPMTQEGIVPIKSASVEQCHAPQSSQSIQFDLQNQVKRCIVRDSNSERSEADKHDEETSKRQKPVAIDDDPTIEIVNSADSQNRENLRSGESEVSTPKNSDAECTDKPVSTIEKPHVFDASNLDCPDDFQPPTASVLYDGTTGNSLELMSINVSSGCYSGPFSKEMKIETSPLPEESKGIPMTWNERAFSCCILNSNGCKAHDPVDIVRQSSEDYKSNSKMYEIPSFDLGF